MLNDETIKQIHDIVREAKASGVEVKTGESPDGWTDFVSEYLRETQVIGDEMYYDHFDEVARICDEALKDE